MATYWRWAAVFCLSLLGLCLCARADLTLTAAGVSDGYGLTTFASGFPVASTAGGMLGPVGIGFTPSGGVMVSDVSGNVRVFPTDTDGQTIAAAPSLANYGSISGNLWQFAQDGSTLYAPRETGTVLQINIDGTINRQLVSGFSQPRGLVFDTYTNHLLISASGGLRDVDPVSGQVTHIVDVSGPDGIALSPNGAVIYAAIGGHVLGYNVTNGAQVFDSGAISTVDGIAIGVGTFTGYLFANCNNGTVYQVPLAGGTPVQIAAGGTRGDLVTVDPKDGSLLLTQTSTIVRLTGPTLSVVHPIANLGAASALYGSAITNGSGAAQGIFTGAGNSLSVSKNGSGYTASAVTNVNGGAGIGTGTITLTSGLESSDGEVIGLEVLVGGTLANAGQIAMLVTDLNSTHSYGVPGTIASASDPSPAAFGAISPGVPYNLFLTFPGSGAKSFGFDLSQDPALSGSATVAAVGVTGIPEPCSVALLAVLAMCLGTRFRRPN